MFDTQDGATLQWVSRVLKGPPVLEAKHKGVLAIHESFLEPGNTPSHKIAVHQTTKLSDLRRIVLDEAGFVAPSIFPKRLTSQWMTG